MHQKIESIQILRIVGAVSVFLYHTDFFGRHGRLGVEILFVVSGFVMMLSTETKKPHFFLKRAIRIIPLYWAATLAIFALLRVMSVIMPTVTTNNVASLENLLKSLFFIPYQNAVGLNLPLLGVGWTINYEIYFYIIFGIALKLSHKYRMWISSGVIVLLYLIGQTVGRDNYYLHYLGDSVLLECIWGMLVYQVYLLVDKMERKKHMETTCFAVAVLCYVYLWWEPVKLDAFRGFLLGIPGAVLVFCFMYFLRKRKAPEILVKLGNISYSFFIMGYFAPIVFQVIAGYLSNVFLQFVSLVVLLLATLGASYISYYIFEKKQFPVSYIARRYM